MGFSFKFKRGTTIETEFITDGYGDRGNFVVTEIRQVSDEKKSAGIKAGLVFGIAPYYEADFVDFATNNSMTLEKWENSELVSTLVTE